MWFSVVSILIDNEKVIIVVKICCETIVLFMHVDISKIFTGIDHFTVVGLVTWRLNGSEAGVEFVLIQTSLFLLCKSSCSYAN